jgi:site-specific DNA-cytosine methylase
MAGDEVSRPPALRASFLRESDLVAVLFAGGGGSSVGIERGGDHRVDVAINHLFNAQGFPPGYVIDPPFGGKPLTKTAQIECAGNSVCPQVAEAIVRSQFGTREAVAA